MCDVRFFDLLGRKTIITGHYGSGKTEFAISLALLTCQECVRRTVPLTTCQENRPPDNISLIDLDIVNPYFRSREKRELLESKGITVYGSVYKEEIGAELPAIDAAIRAPLENESEKVIIDAGGNDTGALILNQFEKYFTDDETTLLAIVNANRPETSDTDGIIEHITAIEEITSLSISFLVNNTHMLHETTVADIIHGHTLCKDVCKITDKNLLCNCYPEGIIDPEDLTELTEQNENLMPLGLYMRPTWLK